MSNRRLTPCDGSVSLSFFSRRCLFDLATAGYCDKLQGQGRALSTWVERVVVRQGLCPWAEGALRSGGLAVVSLEESQEEEVAAAVLAHAQLLAAKLPAKASATTLLVAPRCEVLRRFEETTWPCAVGWKTPLRSWI
ncbi:unnamed protein product [Effrenium voratum]|nr:unnamed protein product [Effrenium voratum]